LSSLKRYVIIAVSVALKTVTVAREIAFLVDESCSLPFMLPELDCAKAGKEMTQLIVAVIISLNAVILGGMGVWEKLSK
jgi:hypothetical protein